MMHPTDIVGYTYRADILCPACTLDRIDYGTGPRNAHGPSPESILDTLATERGIDREDEATYDSDRFPKVVFRDQTEDLEGCTGCGERLV